MNKNRMIVVILVLLLTTTLNLNNLMINIDNEDTTLRVMTYNIHQYYVEDYVSIPEKTGNYNFEALLEVIKNASPNIIGLQESEGARISSGNQNGVEWLAAQLDMYYYYGPSSSEQIYGVSILSEWPIIEQEWRSLPRQESIERAIIRVVIDSPFGEIPVYNTHFQTSSFKIDQREQANFVVDYVGKEKALILGDFNTRADLNDEAYHILYNQFDYAWVAAGNHPNSTDSYTSPAGNPGHKVDYIWLSGLWDVQSGSTRTYGNAQASDHLAVFTVLNP